MQNIRTNTEEKVILLSKQGIKDIKKSIAQLEHDRQALIVSLHDNHKMSSHYYRLERVERLAQLEAIESELYDKQQTLNGARLIPSKRARMKVAIG